MTQDMCPITGLTVAGSISEDQYTHYYQVMIVDKLIDINIAKPTFKKITDYPYVQPYWHVVIGLLASGKLDINGEIILWDEPTLLEKGVFDLKREIQTASYPRTPKEKQEFILKKLHSQQKYEGERVTLKTFKRGPWTTWYFTNLTELKFYINSLEQDQYAYVTFNEEGIHYRFTIKGLNEFIRLSNEGESSKKCFIAMAFQDETKQIREAIRKALTTTGFEPVIVDEKHISSERTINDEIIASLKQCKFCIADFSYHKNGVYFESGFALGQGKQVIYTCQKEEFAKAHFDIKPLQHIIYDNPEELERKLIAKIEAWIK